MTSEPNSPHFVRTQRSMYPYLLVAFVCCLVVSNVAATKGVLLFPELSFSLGPISIDGLITDGAFWLFPLSYVLGDIITEVYGFKAMRRTIATAFAAMLGVVASFWVVVQLPAAGFYDGQDSLAAVVGVVPQIFLASLAAFTVGELLNSYVLVRIKRATGESKLWARLLGSTVVGEFADTLVFCAIAAPAIGITTSGDFINFVVVGFVWKTLIEAVVLPVTYAIIGWVKRYEGYYDDQPHPVQTAPTPT